MTEPEVTDADREAAADVLYDKGTLAHDHVLSGEWGTDLAQVFARRRLAAYEAGRLAGIEEADRAVWDAGGDNVEWHSYAIRTLKEKQP